jgi:hypothetical protein
LKRGDIGAVFHLHSPDCVEVEFVRASGHTRAVVTLSVDQLLPVGPRDDLAIERELTAIPHFEVTPFDLGPPLPGIDLDNVGALLDHLEGPARR